MPLLFMRKGFRFASPPLRGGSALVVRHHRAMKLYIVVRWGNHESPDGPDGEDTHFLIRARDHDEVVKLADEILGSMPTACTEGNRSVQPFCHKIIEIGSDSSTFAGVESQVLMGPWVAYGYAVHHVGYATWNRDHFDKNVWEKETHDA